MRSLLQPGTSSKTSPHRCKKLSPKSHPSQVLTLHLQYSPQAMQKPCQTFQFNIILNHISDITHQLSSITRPISYITHQNIIFQYHKDHIPGILRPSTSLSPPHTLQINRTVSWIKDDTIDLLLFMPPPASVLPWIQERYHLIADEYFKPPAKKMHMGRSYMMWEFNKTPARKDKCVPEIQKWIWYPIDASFRTAINGRFLQSKSESYHAFKIGIDLPGV